MTKIKDNHIHQFKRGVYKSSGERYFYCTGDTCQFKISVEQALGKVNLCWRCGNPFKLTSYSLRLAKPHCPNCHNKKPSEKLLAPKATDILNSEALGLTNEIHEERRESLVGRREEDKAVLPILAEKVISDLQIRLNHPLAIQHKESDDDLLD